MRHISLRQRRWILGGLVIGALLVMLMVFRESLRDTVHPLLAGFSTHENRMESSGSIHDDMPMASSSEMRTPQANAMINSARQQLIGVKTDVVEQHPLQTVIRIVGRVEYDEERITHVNLRMEGWVEQLFVDFTGQFVRKDQPLFTLYSRELVATQEEYLLALRAQEDIRDSPLTEIREQSDHMVEAARDRLRLWTITDRQIEDLARRGTPQTYVTIYSPSTGYIVNKKVFKGMYVKPETTVYEIADLSTVWVLADVFEYEIPFIRVGQTGTLTVDAHPDQPFHGTIQYIYPYLNQQARTVKVRLVFQNPDLRLKPEMYGTVRIQVDRGTKLAVPEEAVLDTGTRQVVFVVRGEGLFEPRDVRLGPKVGSYYEVEEGLQKGERIVTSGTFLLDSESKLMASTHMMGPLGMGGIKMEQAHMGQMEMNGMDTEHMDMSGRDMSETTPDSRPLIPGTFTDTHATPGIIETLADGLAMVFSTEPSPPRVGENRMVVAIKDATGKSVTNAHVRITYTMSMPGMTPATAVLREEEEGIYVATINLGMAGSWDIQVGITQPGQPEVQETYSVRAVRNHSSGLTGQ